MASITTAYEGTRVSAERTLTSAAWLPVVPAYVALLPQSQHGVVMGTGVLGGVGFAAAAQILADAKPNARTGRLPRDRQPV